MVLLFAVKYKFMTFRTVARQPSIGRLYVCAGGFAFGLTFQFDKNSTTS